MESHSKTGKTESNMTSSCMSANSLYVYPPGPPQKAIIGNAHNIDASDLNASLWKHREEYGDISYFRLGGRNIVCLHTLEAAREVMVSDDVSKYMLNRPGSFVSKYGLPKDIALQNYSKDWHNLRCAALRGIMSTLSSSKHVTLALNEEMIKLKDWLKLENESNDDPFSPITMLNYSSINSVLTTLMARRFHYDHDIFTLFLKYGKHADAIFTPSARLWLTLMPVLRFLPFGYGTHYRAIWDLKDKIAQETLHVVQRESKNSKENSSGLIYELLRAGKTHTSITDDNIKDVILDAYSAGVVSVRATLYAVFYHLLYHPEAQSKIYDEILKVIGKSETPKAEHEKKMPYVMAVITESMRITTVVPQAVPRCSSDNVTLRGYCLPKDTIFMVNLWRIQHDEEFWPEPWVFKPDRFLDEDGNLLKDKVNDVNPFGFGQRSCLGESFARSRIFLYVVNLCQAYELINTDKGEEIDARSWIRDTVMYAPEYKIRLNYRNENN